MAHIDDDVTSEISSHSSNSKHTIAKGLGFLLAVTLGYQALPPKVIGQETDTKRTEISIPYTLTNEINKIAEFNLNPKLRKSFSYEVFVERTSFVIAGVDDPLMRLLLLKYATGKEIDHFFAS